jgi:hypothetical protein
MKPNFLFIHKHVNGVQEGVKYFKEKLPYRVADGVNKINSLLIKVFIICMLHAQIKYAQLGL